MSLLGYNFGECQDGSPVDNVILPSWSERKDRSPKDKKNGDPRLFVLKHRQVCVHN